MADEPERFSFDGQAGAFERRTGIPREAARSIARDLAAALLTESSDLLLDMGAGSGELGQHLAQYAPRYLGIDRSRPMLARFQTRPSRLPFPLVQADADVSWPVRPACVRAILFSRSAHLMDLPHMLRELRRVAHPRGAWVVIGRVERDPGSMRSVLREQMLHILDQHSRFPAARGGPDDGSGRARRGAGRIERALVDWGARVEPRRVGGRWVVHDSLVGVLEDWRSKPGLAGGDLDPQVKREVLGALEAWAVARFGTLEGSVESCERRFEWTPIRLPVPLSPPPRTTHVQAPSQ